MSRDMEVGERYVAQVKVASTHLRLFSEVTPAGIVALVYDVKANQIMLKEYAASLQDGREKCEECAQDLVGKPIHIVWKHQP